MPVKRSRPGSSSRHLENPVPVAVSNSYPLKTMKTDALGKPSRPSILAVASSVNAAEYNQQQIGGFLERCHYCKKRIDQNSEVYMYSTLCAFCSPECRDCQISLDHSAEKQPKTPPEKSA